MPSPQESARWKMTMLLTPAAHITSASAGARWLSAVHMRKRLSFAMASVGEVEDQLHISIPLALQ